MIRYLTERDVEELLTMPLALEMVERGLRDRATGKAVDVPRVRARTPAGSQHILQAAAPAINIVGYKVYYSPSGG
jgi:ornithine cyclodeaminase/alanine dehydrogenase-like protein (mu-crystallin family)